MKSIKNANRNLFEILSFRDRFKNGERSIENSLVLLIEPVAISETEERMTTIGWERNKKNQLHPRIVDMSSSMNTEKLAESAVNLNLKVKI
jgi:ubiquitin-like modifier-activating enzyme ATG7